MHPGTDIKILLTHTPQMRAQYYGQRALDALRALAEVHLHEGDDALDAEGVVAAARDIDIIIADRITEGPGEIFDLPGLRAMLRVAVDIRNIDVASASACGVLVTRARPGFLAAVTELALGFLVDCARGISRSSDSCWYPSTSAMPLAQSTRNPNASSVTAARNPGLARRGRTRRRYSEYRRLRGARGWNISPGASVSGRR